MDQRQELQSLRSIPTQSRLYILIACFVSVVLCGCSASKSKDDAAVLVPIQAMFDGMAHHDAAIR